MAKPRSYKLLCPIARGLDRIGDRWTLLILRDLHAGPARFTDLQRGLTGIAANLLTERLGKLMSDGLIEKSEEAHGATTYRLTDLGRRTGDIILDLAVFGAQFAPETETVEPGNLRTVATTLGLAAQRVVSDELVIRTAIVVDGEELSLVVAGGQAQALYATCPDPDVTLATSYSALLDVSEGRLSLQDFAEQHAYLTVHTPGKESDFLTFMARLTKHLADA